MLHHFVLSARSIDNSARRPFVFLHLLCPRGHININMKFYTLALVALTNTLAVALPAPSFATGVPVPVNSTIPVNATIAPIKAAFATGSPTPINSSIPVNSTVAPIQARDLPAAPLSSGMPNIAVPANLTASRLASPSQRKFLAPWNTTLTPVVLAQDVSVPLSTGVPINSTGSSNSTLARSAK